MPKCSETQHLVIDSKSQDETSLSRSQSSVINFKDLADFVKANLSKHRKTDNYTHYKIRKVSYAMPNK